MVLPLIGQLRWASFGAGAAAAVVGAYVGRPLLVGAVRAGYDVSELASDAWAKAKAEADSLRQEAQKLREQSASAEVQRLREEVATLRAQVATKKA
jgi:hypothetical protein